MSINSGKVVDICSRGCSKFMTKKLRESIKARFSTMSSLRMPIGFIATDIYRHVGLFHLLVHRLAVDVSSLLNRRKYPKIEGSFHYV